MRVPKLDAGGGWETTVSFVVALYQTSYSVLSVTAKHPLSKGSDMIRSYSSWTGDPCIKSE